MRIRHRVHTIRVRPSPWTGVKRLLIALAIYAMGLLLLWLSRRVFPPGNGFTPGTILCLIGVAILFLAGSVMLVLAAGSLPGRRRQIPNEWRVTLWRGRQR